MIPVQTKKATMTCHEMGLRLLEGRHILVADDSLAIRFVAAAALRAQGATVVEVSNGEEAIVSVLSDTFDLLVLDVQMPEVDGLDATRRIRSHGFTKLPILAITASSYREHEACFQAGMNDVVQKPFTQATFIGQVLACLDGIPYIIAQRIGLNDAAESPLFSTESLLALCGGDETFMKRMLNIAVQELPYAAQQMLFAYDNGDLVQVGKMAHRVRPCAQGLGIASLPERLLQIEALALANMDSVGLSRLITSAANELERIARQIIKSQ
jgi:CheY-like chemotaxis protein